LFKYFNYGDAFENIVFVYINLIQYYIQLEKANKTQIHFYANVIRYRNDTHWCASIYEEHGLLHNIVNEISGKTSAFATGGMGFKFLFPSGLNFALVAN